MSSIIPTNSLKKASASYTELYNDRGLVVNHLKSGRFEIKCGSNHTYAHSLSEVGDKVNALDLHSFPGSGEEVLASINKKLAGQYDLNIVKISVLDTSKEEVVHSIRGNKETIKDQILGAVDLDVEAMEPGRRYNITSAYGGDYAVLVPVSGKDLIELSPSPEEGELYENQSFNRGDVLYGIDPTNGSEVSVLVKEAYPNGTFKDSEDKIYTEADIEIYGLTVGAPAPVEDFREPDNSLFESSDVPSYNPVGDVSEIAPMIGDLCNYDTILSSSSEVLAGFMKSVSKVAYLDRASINKISVSAVNDEGQATDGSLEYNVTIASPYYKRSSQITVPMTMKNGSVELGRQFTASTGRKFALTAEALKEHLGELAGDDEYLMRNVQSVHASTNKSDRDLDAVIKASTRKVAEDLEDTSDEESSVWYVVRYDSFIPSSSHFSIQRRYEEHPPAFVLGAENATDFEDTVDNFTDYTVFAIDPVSNDRQSAIDYAREQGYVLVDTYDILETPEEYSEALSDIAKTLDDFMSNGLPLDRLYEKQYGADDADFHSEASKKTATLYVVENGEEVEADAEDFKYWAEEFGRTFLDSKGEEIDKETALENLGNVSAVYNPQGVLIARNDKWNSYSSKKTSAKNLNDEQIAFLLEWAAEDQIYGPFDIEDYAQTNNAEDIFESLPEEYQDRENLVEDIPWGDIADISVIDVGKNFVDGVDYHRGHRTYLVYDSEHMSEKQAKSLLNIFNSDYDRDDLGILGFVLDDKEIPFGMEEPEFVTSLVNEFMSDLDVTFIDPYEGGGMFTSFLGADLIIDNEGTAYIV